MVIGEHNKETDIDLNPCKEKKLTNVRTVLADEKIVLTPPRNFTVDEVISYVRGKIRKIILRGRHYEDKSNDDGWFVCSSIISWM